MAHRIWVAGLRRHVYPPPAGGRWLADCDIADLALFPQRYPGIERVRFGAGLELSVLHLGLWCPAASFRASTTACGRDLRPVSVFRNQRPEQTPRFSVRSRSSQLDVHRACVRTQPDALVAHPLENACSPRPVADQPPAYRPGQAAAGTRRNAVPGTVYPRRIPDRASGVRRVDRRRSNGFDVIDEAFGDAQIGHHAPRPTRQRPIASVRPATLRKRCTGAGNRSKDSPSSLLTGGAADCRGCMCMTRFYPQLGHARDSYDGRGQKTSLLVPALAFAFAALLPTFSPVTFLRWIV